MHVAREQSAKTPSNGHQLFAKLGEVDYAQFAARASVVSEAADLFAGPQRTDPARERRDLDVPAAVQRAPNAAEEAARVVFGRVGVAGPDHEHRAVPCWSAWDDAESRGGLLVVVGVGTRLWWLAPGGEESRSRF